ncbi:MAG: hypothetical protein OQK03_11915, partial [Colwellia sp.]|nr:hypothetical protein [Colwellia sp.]
MTNPTNEIFINNIRESLQFSSLIYSPIFMPASRENEKPKKIVKIDIGRTDWETIEYEGVCSAQLNQDTFFKEL